MARHPLDGASLVAGLAFILIGLLSQVGDLSFGDQANIVWPLLLAALGLGLLLSGRRRAAEAESGEAAAADAREADDA